MTQAQKIKALEEQIAALTKAITGAQAPVRKAKASGDIVAQAQGFTFAWTKVGVAGTGATKFRLAITDSSGRTLTHGEGYPYRVNEAERTLQERVDTGKIKFAISLAKTLAKRA